MKYTLVFDTQLFEERTIEADSLDEAIAVGRDMLKDPFEDLDEHVLVRVDWEEDGAPCTLTL